MWKPNYTENFVVNYSNPNYVVNFAVNYFEQLIETPHRPRYHMLYQVDQSAYPYLIKFPSLEGLGVGLAEQEVLPELCPLNP